MSDTDFTAEEQAQFEEMQAADQQQDAPAQAETPEAPPEQEQAGEQKAQEPKFETQREKPPAGYVPHQALHAEREERKKLEQRLKELEEAKQVEEAEPEPEWADPILDPEAHRKYEEYQKNRVLDRLEKMEKSQNAQAEQQRNAAQLDAQEKAFAQEHPDYYDVTQALVQSRGQELAGLGYGPDQIPQIIAQDIHNLTEAAGLLGMTVPALAYQQAQLRGITAGQKPQQTDDAQKVVALAEAQKKTQGFGQSGAPQAGEMTPQMLADMSDEEFAKVPFEQVRKIMGG